MKLLLLLLHRLLAEIPISRYLLYMHNTWIQRKGLSAKSSIPVVLFQNCLSTAPDCLLGHTSSYITRRDVRWNLLPNEILADGRVAELKPEQELPMTRCPILGLAPKVCMLW